MGQDITTLVSTHHPELKAFAHATQGVVNASVEFDLETLQPTYHLTIGLPGRSNALAIAERLGIPNEIIAAARGKIDPTDLQADDLLDEIYRQRDNAKMARQRAEQAGRESETLRSELSERLESIEEERRKVLEEARKKAQAEVKAIREELKDLRRALKRARQPLDVIQEVEDQVEDMEEEVEAPVERQVQKAAPVEGTIRLGAKVSVPELGKVGIVRAISETRQRYKLGCCVCELVYRI